MSPLQATSQTPTPPASVKCAAADSPASSSDSPASAFNKSFSDGIKPFTDMLDGNVDGPGKGQSGQFQGLGKKMGEELKTTIQQIQSQLGDFLKNLPDKLPTNFGDYNSAGSGKPFTAASEATPVGGSGVGREAAGLR